MSIVTWNELSDAEQLKYLDQAYYLIENKYAPKDSDIEQIAKKLFENTKNPA